MTFTQVGSGRSYIAESADILPSDGILPASTVFLTDTQDRLVFDGSDWFNLPRPTVVALDGSVVTSSATELNFNDNAVAGAAVAGKTLVAGAAKELPTGLVENILTKNADYPVVVGDSDKIILVTAADKIMTLPSTVAGLRFTFILTAAGLSTGAGLKISPAAADMIIGNGFTPADNKDAILAGSGDRAGDMIEVVGDGSAGWYITRVIGTWTRE